MVNNNKHTLSCVIVESPAKCAIIEKYLGPGYKCIASCGHLRELPSLKCIDTANGYAQTYSIIEKRKKQLEFMRTEMQRADEIILATDDDREGEAIAWHICQMFNLDVGKTKRIIFHEITESALQNAIKTPTRINMKIVNAQQSRQILDLLVGFKVSPMLWKYISKNSETALSAGRCQTPALRIIYDNYVDVKNSKPKQVYNTVGYFTNQNIPFELNRQFASGEDATDFLHGSSSFDHKYTCSQPIKVVKPPPDPFVTSRLQQVASNLFRYSPKETMKLCQSLYEGGFISYMRTDSKKYSVAFVDKTTQYISGMYGANYIGESLDLIVGSSSRTDNKQEAHEAIRPTDVSLLSLPDEYGSKEKKLYKLIRETAVESCMASAKIYMVTAQIAGFNNARFEHSSETVDFAGWKIVDEKQIKVCKEYQYLQTIKPNCILPYKKMMSSVTVVDTKPHYSEAMLVRLLEENGIGRPSTFSMLVDKIQERGYVKKEDIKGTSVDCTDFELTDGDIYAIESKREFGNEHGKLVIQNLGILIIEFLIKHFNDLFNYDYTRTIEDELDKISHGDKLLPDVCGECDVQLNKLIGCLTNENKLEIKIDSSNTYVIGKHGPVIKCTEMVNEKAVVTFKNVRGDVDVRDIENGDYKIEDLVSDKQSFVLGKYQGDDVIIRKGKYGAYITWGSNRKSIKDLGNRPLENIRFEEIEKYLTEGSNIIREISNTITIRKGPKGDYVFYKLPKMSKPSFYKLAGFKEDYKICDVDILKSWLKDTYKIY